jgi:hypothetical protein
MSIVGADALAVPPTLIVGAVALADRLVISTLEALAVALTAVTTDLVDFFVGSVPAV